MNLFFGFVIKSRGVGSDSADSLTKNVYSSFRCIGDHGYSYESGKRLCHFKNICLHQSTQRFLFFADPNDKEGSVIDSESRYGDPKWGLDQFPDPFITLRFNDDGKAAKWTPTVIRQSIPIREDGQGQIKKASFHDRQIHVIYEPYWEENIGHFLYDDLYTVFSSVKQFDLPYHKPSDLQLIVTRGCEIFKGAEFDRCTRFHKEWALAISSHQRFNFYLDNIGDLGTDSVICFRNLVVGAASLRTFCSADYMRQLFRKQIIEYFLKEHSIPKKQLITILDKGKTSRRHIIDVEGVASKLRATFGIETILVSNIHELSVSEQILLMMHTTVLITAPGGLSMTAMFLAPGSTAIFLDYYNANDGNSEAMEGYMWTHISHMSHYRYRVRKEDIVIDESNARGLRLDTYTLYRNYGNYKINHERITRLVYSALKEVELYHYWNNSFKRPS